MQEAWSVTKNKTGANKFAFRIFFSAVSQELSLCDEVFVLTPTHTLEHSTVPISLNCSVLMVFVAYSDFGMFYVIVLKNKNRNDLSTEKLGCERLIVS